MTATFHALWMLCGLGTVVCAAIAGRRTRQIGAFAIALAAAAVLVGPARVPAAAWVGALAGACALVYLCRFKHPLVGAVCGGGLAGIWVGLLEVQGLHKVVAVALVGLVVACTVWLSRSRAGFAPAVVLDEAQIIVLAIALAVAALPGILDGWRAAVGLTVQSDAGSTAGIPGWTLALVGSSLALGGLYARWSHR